MQTEGVLNPRPQMTEKAETYEVVIPAHGNKFHEKGCRQLYKTDEPQPLTVKDALDENYSPCWVCMRERLPESIVEEIIGDKY